MKVILTGSTGMIGKGVLYECIDDPRVSEILLINRNSVGITHQKVTELIHKDFSNFDSISDQLSGYDAAFHCMGVSSAGMDTERYTALTYGITAAFAKTLYALHPAMVMIYVSGLGSDETETSGTMWQRVKGKTENLVLNTGFKHAYAFRPGAIIPERGIASRTRIYNIVYFFMRPFFPLLKRMKSVTTTTTIGKAMISTVVHLPSGRFLEGARINELAAL